jgi:hypothetical protein
MMQKILLSKKCYFHYDMQKNVIVKCLKYVLVDYLSLCVIRRFFCLVFVVRELLRMFQRI